LSLKRTLLRKSGPFTKRVVAIWLVGIAGAAFKAAAVEVAVAEAATDHRFVFAPASYQRLINARSASVICVALLSGMSFNTDDCW
jgi:hypothetical protein